MKKKKKSEMLLLKNIVTQQTLQMGHQNLEKLTYLIGQTWQASLTAGLGKIIKEINALPSCC